MKRAVRSTPAPLSPFDTIQRLLTERPCLFTVAQCDEIVALAQAAKATADAASASVHQQRSMPKRTRSTPAGSSSAASPLILSVPDSVLSDFALVPLPARSLGCAAMACVKLRQCAGDAILQIARSIHVRRREGESVGSLLFAIRVLKPLGLEAQAQDGGGGGGGEVLTFGSGGDGQLGHDGEDN